MVAYRNVCKPHLRVEERQLQAGIDLRTGREFKTLQKHLVHRFKNETSGREIFGHRHTVFSGADCDSVAGVAVVTDGCHTRQGEVGTHLNCQGSLDTHVAFVNAGHRLIDERTCLVIVVAVELCSVPGLGEETGYTTANDRVVELIGQVSSCNLLTRCIEIYETLGIVVCIDGAYNGVVYTLRDIGIACVRSTCLGYSIQLQVVTTVDLVVDTEFECRIQEMVRFAKISCTCCQCSTLLCIFDACIGCFTVVHPGVGVGRLVCNLGQVPSTTVEHVGGTLHRGVVERDRVVQIQLVERPLVLEPDIGFLHVDAVVVAEMATVCLDDVVIVRSDLILTYVVDIFLRETAVGSQLFDVAVCEGINVNPLVTTEQVVNRLIMNTLRVLILQADRHLQVVM